jgi:ketosteroid isomerase-like protein
MSENIEVVRRAVAELNRAEFDSAPVAFTDDFELDFTNSRGPMSGIYRGLNETVEFLRAFVEPWAEVEFDPNAEMSELEDGRVFTVNSLRARGDQSGVEVTATGAAIWTVRDGKVAAMKLYQSKAEALEAVSSAG